MHGCTQNTNVSFNGCNLKRMPKTKFVSLNTLQTGVMYAVICFDDDMLSRRKVFEVFGIFLFSKIETSLRKTNRVRTVKAEQNLSKEARRKKNDKKCTKCRNVGTKLLCFRIVLVLKNI